MQNTFVFMSRDAAASVHLGAFFSEKIKLVGALAIELDTPPDPTLSPEGRGLSC
jgi:hypothetical protein